SLLISQRGIDGLGDKVAVVRTDDRLSPKSRSDLRDFAAIGVSNEPSPRVAAVARPQEEREPLVDATRHLDRSARAHELWRSERAEAAELGEIGLGDHEPRVTYIEIGPGVNETRKRHHDKTMSTGRGDVEESRKKTPEPVRPPGAVCQHGTAARR